MMRSDEERSRSGGRRGRAADTALQDLPPPAARCCVLRQLHRVQDVQAGPVQAPLLLLLGCSLFAGYDMAIRRHLNVLYAIAFAVVLSVTTYVIIDLEYPHLGLMQVTDSDKVLVNLRQSMN